MFKSGESDPHIEEAFGSVSAELSRANGPASIGLESWKTIPHPGILQLVCVDIKSSLQMTAWGCQASAVDISHTGHWRIISLPAKTIPLAGTACFRRCSGYVDVCRGQSRDQEGGWESASPRAPCPTDSDVTAQQKASSWKTGDNIAQRKTGLLTAWITDCKRGRAAPKERGSKHRLRHDERARRRQGRG